MELLEMLRTCPATLWIPSLPKGNIFPTPLLVARLTTSLVHRSALPCPILALSAFGNDAHQAGKPLSMSHR